MAYKVADRVKETTVVTGTGPATLLGAASGYRTFASQLSIGDTCAYAIVNANASEWEVGIGTYSAANTLTRTTVHASTNANAAVVFTAGTKDVFLSPTAETVLSDVTSADGTVTLTKTGSIVDLSVAVAAATTNVIVQVRNTTGATLTKGTVVYINNAIGQIPTVAKALATSDATSAQTLGMISADINDNANGYVTIIGLINDINTGSYLDGDQLYLSGTTAGEFTKVKPYAPTHLVYVGIVEHAHNVHGKIFVKVQNGYELDELHDVSAQNPSDGQTIVYNSTTDLWEKAYVSRTNSLSSVPVVSGAGNSLTLTAGSGVGTGAGGSLILQAGLQATSGGDGKVIVKQVAGQTSNLQEWQDSSAGIKAFVDSKGNIGTGLNAYSNRLVIGPDLTGLVGSNSVGLQMSGNGQLAMFFASTESVRSNINQTWVQAAHSIIWSPSFNSATINTALTSDGSATLAQRNGTNAQSFRLYNTYTNASNYERLGITWATNVCTISPENAGTGAARGLSIQSGTGLPVYFGSSLQLQSASLVFKWYNGSTIGVGPSFSDIYFTNPNNFVSVRNGTAGQKFGVYNTFTDVSNYERLAATWASNICTIGLEQAGTGLPRTLNVNANALNAPSLPVAATVTAATGNGTTITYTCANTFSVGQVVSVTGLTITTGSSLNIANMTIASATSTQFTVTNTTVGTAAATQAGTATIQSAGNSVTITAGNGSGVGAGGDVILTPGLQGTSGGNGSVRIGSSTTLKWTDTDYVTNTNGNGFVFTSGGASRLGLSYYSGYYQVSIPGTLSILPQGSTINLANAYVTYQTLEYGSFGTIKVSQGRFGGYGFGTSFAFPSYTQNVGSALTITNKSLAGNVATLTTSTPHKLIYGQVVTISGVDATFDGTYTITQPQQTNLYSTLTTFSYSKTAADVASQAATGTATVVLNDLNIGPTPFVRINTQTPQSITGLIAPWGYGSINAGTHVDGRMIRVYNVGGANLTLSHNSVSSTATNRFFNATGADIVLSTHQYVELIYDSTDNGRGGAGWRVSSVH